MKVAKIIAASLAGLLLVAALVSSFFTTPEGYRTVVYRLGSAEYQTPPGLHLKYPFIESARDIEVRLRRTTEDLAAATANQLPITARVSINWQLTNEGQALNIAKNYGSLAQFEERVLGPRMRQVAKAALSQFDASALIRERGKAVGVLAQGLAEAFEGISVDVSSPNIENIDLPPQYMDAILAKEKAREDAVKEQHKLEQQALIAQQAVQTATAQAQATRVEADALAYRTVTVATADAEGQLIKRKAEAEGAGLLRSAVGDLEAYLHAMRWDGKLPKTMLGGETGALLSMPVK